MKDLVVISGGGFSQLETGLGCLKALEESGLTVNSRQLVDYRGTSAGAICSALMSAGMTPGETIDMVRANPVDKLIYRSWYWPLRMLLGSGIYDRSGLESMLRLHIPKEPLINVEVCMTQVPDMKNVKVQASYDTVLASSSIDGVFAPVLINGIKYIDGGYTDNVPYEPYMSSQYRYVFIVLYPGDPVAERHLETLIGRLLDGFSSKLSQEVNEAELVYDQPDKYPNIVVLRPPPTTTSLLAWSPKYELLTYAYAYAKKKLKARFPNGLH